MAQREKQREKQKTKKRAAQIERSELEANAVRRSGSKTVTVERRVIGEGLAMQAIPAISGPEVEDEDGDELREIQSRRRNRMGRGAVSLMGLTHMSPK